MVTFERDLEDFLVELWVLEYTLSDASSLIYDLNVLLHSMETKTMKEYISKHPEKERLIKANIYTILRMIVGKLMPKKRLIDSLLHNVGGYIDALTYILNQHGYSDIVEKGYVSYLQYLHREYLKR